jgi:Zn-dependent peptidase ImmA (M78 family)/DNA-binding XRE family transcriptional regulator
VSPPVLVWARESISLSSQDAAKKLGISEETLGRWESGDLAPTISQLRKAADKYKRPLGVLLLAEPPRTFDAMRDFRRGTAAELTWSPELHGEFRRALDQRDVFVELSEISADSVPTAERPPAISQGSDVDAVGEVLREYLGITTDQQLKWSDVYEALNAWVSAVESKGIIVIHTRNVSNDEMRAFSINEWPYPVIALNGSDFPRGRIFSLVHELVHLAINLGGLCDLHDEDRPSTPDDRLEHYCNQVSGAVLLPRELVLNQPEVEAIESSYNWTLSELSSVSQRFGVSSEALLLRLISLGKANWVTYERRREEFRFEYDSVIAARRLRRVQGRGGANYYRTKARDIGHGYAVTVLEAYGNQVLSSRDVADLLNIKFGQISKLQAELH